MNDISREDALIIAIINGHVPAEQERLGPTRLRVIWCQACNWFLWTSRPHVHAEESYRYRVPCGKS